MFSLLLCIVMLSTLIQVKEASATCYDHSKQNVKVTKEPTCTKTGTREYRCKNCNYLVKSETIPAKGHNVQGSKKTVNPTCTASGYTAIICSTCGDEVSRTTIPAKGHSWGSWKTTKNPTCTVAGTKQRSCTVCGAKENGTVDALGHNVQGSKNIVNPTCTAAGYTAIICSRCGVEVSRTTTPAKGHTWGSWSNTKNPTCTATGTKQRSCTVCGVKETGTVAALGHNVQGSKNIVNPTCTAAGYTAIICSRCGVEVSRTTTPAKGHSWGAWSNTKNPTCTATGTKVRQCEVCKTKETGTVAALGHNVQGSKNIVNPTCTAAGYTAIICSRCGVEVSRTTTPAKGHTWGKWQTTKDPTCTATGTKVRQCEVCKTKETGTVAALGHNVQGSKKIVDPTCTKAGYTAIICSRCGAEVSKTTTPAKGHSWGSWKNTKNATCTATGTRQHTCAECSITETQTVKALGHDTSGTPRIVQPTCGSDGYSTATCSRCHIETGSKTILPATGNHSWGSWITDVKATCTADGKIHRECSKCKQTEKKTVEKLGHDTSGNPRIVKPTCEKDGYTSATCSRCSAETGTKTVNKATGHKWGSWITDVKATCTTDGKIHHVCSTCKKTEEKKTEKLGHDTNGTPRIVQPTCGKDGYSSATCSRCSIETGTKTTIPATGNHNWGSWITDVKPTCTTDGKIHHICSTCKKTEEKKAEKLGHDTNGTPRIVKPTCEKDGYTSATCSRCSIETGTKTINKATGHKWGSWITDIKATCTTGGKIHHECSACKKVEEKAVDKLGHDKLGTPRIVQPTCGTAGYSSAVCSRCQSEQGVKTILPATGNHKWGKWIIDIDATCTEDGSKHHDCSVCKQSETQKINRKNHNVQGHYRYEPTCEEVGYDGMKCFDCGEWMAGTKTLPATGHSWSEWKIVKQPTDKDYGEKQRSCSKCKKTEIEKFLNEGTYMIHFNGNGNIFGTMDDMVAYYGKTVKLPECGFDDGQNFDCWGTQPDKLGFNYKAGKETSESLVRDTSVKEITLYALWKEKKYEIEYYDGFWQRLIATDEKSEESHTYRPINGPYINGLRCIGWSRKKPMSFPIIGLSYDRDDVFLWTGYENIIDSSANSFKLYPVYEPVCNSDGYVTLVFYLNGGDSGPNAICRKVGDDPVTIDLTDVGEAHWEGDRRDFKGWATDPDGFNIVNEVVLYSWMNCDVVFASWSSAGHWTEVTLDLGYNGKSESHVVVPEEPYYKLPKPNRSEYDFVCWRASDGKEYKSGETVYVPEEGLTFYAEWERIIYTIEFIDPYTGDLIRTQKAKSTDEIDFIAPSIVGKHLDGWINMQSGDGRVYVKGSLVSDLNIYGKRNYKLKAQYVTDSGRRNGTINVYYHLNGGTGGPTGPSSMNTSTMKLVTSDKEPTRTGCKFTGWSTLPNNQYECKAGKTIDFSYRYCGDEVVLYACWETTYNFVLDSNGFTQNGLKQIKLEDALPKETLHLKNYKKAFGSSSDVELVGWGVTPDKVTIGPDGTFTVPEGDCTLYAIWQADEYTVRFCDGFSGQELKRETVKVNTKLEIPDLNCHVDGYEFTGWTTGGADHMAYPTYEVGKDKYIIVKDNISLYSTYKLAQVDEGKFTIVYAPNGGKGGPGKEVVSPGNHTLSKKEPTRDGYVFKGWDLRNQNEFFVQEPEYPVDKNNVVTGSAGQEMILFAVWWPKSSNSVKHELEDIYGPDAINDAFFDKKYESSDWERIHDKAYYVVRTDDLFHSALGTSLYSTVLVMEYRNGTWYLDQYGTAKESIWETIRFEILTSHTNTTVQVLDLTFNIINALAETTICVFIPWEGTGFVITGIHYLNKMGSVIWWHEEYKSLKEVLIAEAKLAFGATLECGDGFLMGETIKVLADNDKLTDAMMNEILSAAKATEQTIKDDMARNSSQLDPFGDYDKAIGIFRDRVKQNMFCQTIIDNVPKYVNEIYKHVNYNDLGN